MKAYEGLIDSVRFARSVAREGVTSLDSLSSRFNARQRCLPTLYSIVVALCFESRVSVSFLDYFRIRLDFTSARAHAHVMGSDKMFSRLDTYEYIIKSSRDATGDIRRATLHQLTRSCDISSRYLLIKDTRCVHVSECTQFNQKNISLDSYSSERSHPSIFNIFNWINVSNILPCVLPIYLCANI